MEAQPCRTDGSISPRLFKKLQENLAIVPKELFHEDQGVKKNPSKLQTTDSFLDIFQDDLRIRIYENTDEQLLFRVLRNLKNAE